MKARALRLLLLATLAPLSSIGAATTVPATATLAYSIDLNRRADDLFHVTLRVSGLRAENAIYQFASTAPGTYQVMNIGRFVKAFEAYDAKGVRVPAERISVNQWRLSSPARVRTIRYTMTETWDSPLDHPIYKMCGTSIETDHVLINPHAVIGYPEGLQAAPVRLRLAYPAAWTVGTALHRGPDGVFVADSYDQLVDSPILLGRLSKARLVVTGVPIDVFAYSATDKIKARQLLTAMSGMLTAAGRFLGRLPVDHYTFLYHFGQDGAGAWEHSFSSEYVLQEGEFTDSVGHRVTDIAAHEFFHIVTPLNIHSEIIEHFNFVTPVPSRHLWLYEGTTEWAAHAMQLRAGLKTPEAYLQTQIRKMQIDRQAFDSTYSLRRARAHLLQRFGPGAVRQHLHAGSADGGAAGHPAARAVPRAAGAAGPDHRARASLREAARVSRLDVHRYAGGADPSRDPGLLRPLRVGLAAPADQGVLRQARHHADRGRAGPAGALRDRCQSQRRAAPAARGVARAEAARRDLSRRLAQE